MFDNGIRIGEEDLPDSFSEFFKMKIRTLLLGAMISPNVYIGRHKIIAQKVGFILVCLFFD